MIRVRGKAKWNETVGEYSMGFKVQTNSEQLGVPLENSNNRGASPNQPLLFIEGRKKMSLISGGKECELT